MGKFCRYWLAFIALLLQAQAGHGETRENPPDPGGVLQIVQHTPTWVVILFIVLCVFGLKQVRARRVSVGRALLLPVAMVGFSLAGVIQYTSSWLTGVVCWSVGVVVFSATLLYLTDPGFVTVDEQRGYFHIKGSWGPLWVILGIFLTRYVLGVAKALHLGFIEPWPVQMLVALLLGAWSAYFVTRGWRCWQALRASKREPGRAEAVELRSPE